MFFLACILFVALGKGLLLLSVLAALFLHECAHAIVARRLGFALQKFTLTPFGATLSYESGLTGSDEFAVTVAGPLTNLVSCVLTVALWWIVPSLYSVTLSFFRANLGLALYNLLPVPPFDGGRIVLSLCKNKKKAYAALRVAGLILSAFFVVLGIFCVLRGYGYSLLFAAFCSFWTILFPPKNEKYKIIFDQLGVFSSIKPSLRQDVYTQSNATVGSLLRCFKKTNVFYVVHVVSENQTDIILSGEKINRLFFANKRLKLKDVIYSSDTSLL